jgi:YgiT-type zinc finger domain-containing protein
MEKQKMKCRACGEADMTEAQETYRYAESGLSNVTLHSITVRRCPHCGNQTVVIPSIASLHKTIAFALAEHAARLNKDGALSVYKPETTSSHQFSVEG